MQKFKITNELRKDLTDFLQNYGGYKRVLDNLLDPEKTEMSLEEANEMVSLIGNFRLGDAYHLVEKFKTDIFEVKTDSKDATDTQPGE